MARLRRFNYQHLLYFWAVVRAGSLSRACDELALSAPTVSAQLRTLEHRLGEKLLARSGRTLIPTEIGKLVFGYADEIFGLGRELVQLGRTDEAVEVFTIAARFNPYATEWYPSEEILRRVNERLKSAR